MMIFFKICFLPVAPSGLLSTNGRSKTNLFFPLISITARQHVTLACTLLPLCEKLMHCELLCTSHYFLFILILLNRE